MNSISKDKGYFTESELREALIKRFGTDQVIINAMPPPEFFNHEIKDLSQFRVRLANREDFVELGIELIGLDEMVEIDQFNCSLSYLIDRLGPAQIVNKVIMNLHKYTWFLKVYEESEKDKFFICAIDGEVQYDMDNKERSAAWFIYFYECENQIDTTRAIVYAQKVAEIVNNNDEFEIELYRKAAVLPNQELKDKAPVFRHS